VGVLGFLDASEISNQLFWGYANERVIQRIIGRRRYSYKKKQLKMQKMLPNKLRVDLMDA